MSRSLLQQGLTVVQACLPDTRDVLVFGGIASAAYGLGMLHPGAGWIFSGLAVAWLGIR